MKDAMENIAIQPGINQITPKHLANLKEAFLANLKEAFKAYRRSVPTLPISENS